MKLTKHHEKENNTFCLRGIPERAKRKFQSFTQRESRVGRLLLQAEDLKKKKKELKDINLQIKRCAISDKQTKTLCGEIPDVRDNEKLLQMSGG